LSRINAFISNYWKGFLQVIYKHTFSFLKEAGGELLFKGNANPYIIGPLEEEWDMISLVKHASKEEF